jgi:MYXO-CTERM domain-containing protein
LNEGRTPRAYSPVRPEARISEPFRLERPCYPACSFPLARSERWKLALITSANLTEAAGFLPHRQGKERYPGLMSRRYALAVAIWLGGLSLSPGARADAVPGPPTNCPPGAVGDTSHNGPWCRPTTCASDDDCVKNASYWEKGITRVCREQPLCVETREEKSKSGWTWGKPITRDFALGACGSGASCVAPARCETAKRCVVAESDSPGPVGLPSPAGSPGSAGPAGGKSMCGVTGPAPGEDLLPLGALLGLAAVAWRRRRHSH